MCLSPKRLISKGNIMVPCGKCLECRIKKSEEWAYRITYESSLYENNCIITLTYNDDNLPPGASLCLRDLQLFVKRLRKSIAPKKIRYFACGEYGDRKGRPHYHIIIFDFKPTDLYFFCRDKKNTLLYRSPSIEKLWTKGFTSIGDVNFDSAKYVAIYMQKPLKGKKRPFVVMSRRPGIGKDSINPQWLLSDKMYLQGKYLRLPRYFLDVLEKDFPEEVEKLKNTRMERAIKDISIPVWEQNELIAIRKKKFERIFKKTLDKNNMV